MIKSQNPEMDEIPIFNGHLRDSGFRTWMPEKSSHLLNISKNINKICDLWLVIYDFLFNFGTSQDNVQNNLREYCRNCRIQIDQMNCNSWTEGRVVFKVFIPSNRSSLDIIIYHNSFFYETLPFETRISLTERFPVWGMTYYFGKSFLPTARWKRICP